jgi:flagellar export protein FliJ
MPFRFSLETVLRFRKGVERSEEITLHKIVQEMALLQHELLRVEQDQQNLRAQRDSDLARGLPAIHLQELSEKERGLTAGAEQLRTRLRDLEGKRLAQLAVFQTARLNREVLSEVRRQKHDLYEHEQLRREQRSLDEMFLAGMEDDD